MGEAKTLRCVRVECSAVTAIGISVSFVATRLSVVVTVPLKANGCIQVSGVLIISSFFNSG